MTQRFAQLCQAIGARALGDDVEIAAVTHDSRRCANGVLFAACRGATAQSADGHDFIEQAIALGASAVIAERLEATLPIPHALVDDSRVALALAAERLADSPSHAMQVVGITGTNGKTTIVHLLSAAFEACGIASARLGTLGLQGPKSSKILNFTTPEAPEISAALAAVRAEGAQVVAMEVSSHALALRRVDGVRFAVAAFTNLTQDHLDFHGDMASYMAAKRRLFSQLLQTADRPNAVVLVDNRAGRELAELLGERALRVGCAADPTLALAVSDAELRADGTTFTLTCAGRSLSVATQMVGAFNLENTLVALGIVHALGLDLQRAVEGIAGCAPVPGRLERVGSDAGPVVLVDYAHTPDALQQVLATLSEIARGQLLLVFGCGGDRDPHKRAPMGAIAAAGADRVWVTDDNPRSEAPQQIVDAIVRGMDSVSRPRVQQTSVVRDRADAIAQAVAAADVQDMVLIAGKGHEDYQLVGAQRLAFSDREQAAVALLARRSA